MQTIRRQVDIFQFCVEIESRLELGWKYMMRQKLGDHLICEHMRIFKSCGWAKIQIFYFFVQTYVIPREVQPPGIRSQEVRHMLHPSLGADHGGHTRVTGTLGRAHTGTLTGEQQQQQQLGAHTVRPHCGGVAITAPVTSLPHLYHASLLV